ncbi:MAG: PD40 domain-containing protein, partial [Chloroflexia bacterium]|nr:PD40 domain-containing protein [Chloroflexia bacterium]
FAARYTAAEAAEAAGRYALAADLFVDAAGYRDADARAASAQGAYDAAVSAGGTALDAGRYDEAIALLDPLSLQHPGDREITALLVQAHADRHAGLVAGAEDAMVAGDWLLAERTYAALRTADPANTEIAERLSWIQGEHAPLLVGRDDGIYLVGPDLDDERLITTIESVTHPVWSPDRSRIAFTVAREGQTLYGDLYVVGVDGTGRTKVAERVAAFRGVSWSPDGASIAYSSFAAYDRRSGGAVGLRLVDVATRVETDLTGDRWDYALSPSWSPDGGQLAFVNRSLDPDENGDRDVGLGGVQIFDMATKRVRDVTGTALSNAWLVTWSPAPGSERLIVQTKADAVGYAPDPTDLYALDAATGEITAIHVTRALVSHAVWSPDGSRFAYVEEGEVLHLVFWQEGLLRQGWVRLESPSSSTITWSPDGSAILLVAPDGWTPSLLLRFTPDGVVQKPLTIEFRMDYAETAPPQWTSEHETVALPAPTGGTALDRDAATATIAAPLDRQRR